MASFAARRPPRAAWGVEECARFAALKEFELLRYGYSPLIGRRLRRLVAWASLLHIRNRTHLQPLWVELLLRRRPLPLMNRRRRRRCRMLAKSGVPRAARATTLRCEPPSRLIRNRQLQPPRLRKCLRRRPPLPPTRRQSWTRTRRRSRRLPVCSPSFALRRASDHVPPQPHPHRPDLAAAIRACLGAPSFLPRSVGWVRGMAERLGL